MFKGISKRAGRYRVYVQAKYIGSYGKLKAAKEAVATAGGVLENDRSKRMSAEDLIAKSRKYMDWVVDTGYEPADMTASKELRIRRRDLVRGPLPRISLSSKEKRRRGHGSVNWHTTR